MPDRRRPFKSEEKKAKRAASIKRMCDPLIKKEERSAAAKRKVIAKLSPVEKLRLKMRNPDAYRRYCESVRAHEAEEEEEEALVPPDDYDMDPMRNMRFDGGGDGGAGASGAGLVA